jgi:hypothetical protein
MTQIQSPETTQKATEKTTRDVVISGLAGLPGGLFGIPLSIGSYLLWRKIGLNGASRWWAWAATGIIGVPMSLGLTAGLSSSPNSASSSSSASQSRSTGGSVKAQEDVKVGEFQTDSFRYTNVRIAPYTIKNSFAAQQANIAGALYEITADVTNLTKESKAPQLMGIDVSDAQDRKFKEADGMVRFGDMEKGHSPTDYVLPGQTQQDVRLTLIDAAPDSTGFSLKITDGFFDGPKVVKPIQ